MIKKTMTYTDFNGVERTEDFYFNLTDAEVGEMEFVSGGGMEDMLKRIVAAKDNKKIMEIFKMMINKAYGVKSDDGKRFIKNEQVLSEFLQTQAYSDLFIELATNTEKATEWVNGLMVKVKKDNNPKLIK